MIEDAAACAAASSQVFVLRQFKVILRKCQYGLQSNSGAGGGGGGIERKYNYNKETSDIFYLWFPCDNEKVLPSNSWNRPAL